MFATLGKVPRAIFQQLNDAAAEHDDGEDVELGIIIFLFILITYIVVGSWMEKKHFKFGHETGMIIVVGILISLVIR